MVSFQNPRGGSLKLICWNENPLQGDFLFRGALCYAVSPHGEIGAESNTFSLLTYLLNQCSILALEGDTRNGNLRNRKRSNCHSRDVTEEIRD